MKTGTKALVVMMIVLGALATSVLAQPAFADPIASRDCTRDRNQERVRNSVQTCTGDNYCNCTCACQNRYGECSGQGYRTQARFHEQFRNSYQCEEMSMERHRAGSD